MFAALAASGLLLAAAAPVAPSEAQLADALKAVMGARPQLAQVRCQPSGPGYVRCTYLVLKGPGYQRFAVLVTPHDGRWTVSEGPIPEKAPDPVRSRARPG